MKLGENMEKIKGLELSKKYFEKVYLPIIKSEFPEILEKMAAGLAGEGSECFGFDDEISKDHDFGPSCCIWLDNNDFEIWIKTAKKTKQTSKKIYGISSFL